MGLLPFDLCIFKNGNPLLTLNMLILFFDRKLLKPHLQNLLQLSVLKIQ